MRYLLTAWLLVSLYSCDTSGNINKAEYSGKDMTGIVEVLRDKDTKRAWLDIKKDMRWELYAGVSVDSINFSAPISKGASSGVYELDVPDSVRSYFQIVTPEGDAILAERHLPMTGGYNFRDLGGLRTKEGRYVKWGRIFRSDDLGSLTGFDLAYLSSIPIISVVDFRVDAEIELMPDLLPESVEHVYDYQVSPGNLAGMLYHKSIPSAETMASVMEEMNCLMVTEPDVIEQYRKLFTLLTDDANIPLIFHCSAGKDRTGLGAALILLSLCVDEQIVMKDYLSSNIYLAGKYAAILDKNPDLKPLMEVRAEYLGAALRKIKEVYGSIDSYLTDVLGVDLELMKEKYLY